MAGTIIIWYIRLIESISLVVAFLLVALAFAGYKKNNSKAMLIAAVGFGMLGVASLVEGSMYEVFDVALEEAHAFRSSLTSLGLIMLLYSIHKTT